MKSKILGILMVAAIAVAWVAAPAWCQDKDQSTTTPTAEQPAASQAATPAADAPAEQPAEQPMAQPAEQPAAQPAEKPAEQPAAAPAEQSGLQIQDAVVCQDVADRAPVGNSDVFAKDVAKLYCFSRVVGATEQTQITHNWYYKGTLKASVKLAVRSDNWRTWSSKTIDPSWTGEWMVEILSDKGTPLESIIFFIQ